MAYVEQKHCPVCEKVTHHTNGKCSTCSHREELKRLNHWRTKSYDDRLDDLRKRVEALEHPPKY